jgi:alpha-ketoglutaric semialdehyde dehydrogenase
MDTSPILLAGDWISTDTDGPSFQAFSPENGEALSQRFPISGWTDLEAMATASIEATRALATIDPERIGRFLERFAECIEADADRLTKTASLETGLPQPTRLAAVELPRTTDQLRQAARAARDVSSTSWRRPVIDHEANIRSCLEPLGGAVLVMGPCNFPLAFNGISGGDFAAAIAAGNAVIVKGHPAHPETTRCLAEAAMIALEETGMPPATVQCFFHAEHEDIARLIEHHAIASVAFTGGEQAGRAIKSVADQAGKIVSLEMSSLNPVVLLPGADQDDLGTFAETWAGSILLGSGQFCTKPGICFVIDEAIAQKTADHVVDHLAGTQSSLMLTSGIVDGLESGVRMQQDAGAILLTGGLPVEEAGWRFQPTLLMTNGTGFLEMPDSMQRELFGPAALIVACKDRMELLACLRSMGGQLTGCLWGDASAQSGEVAMDVRAVLRPKCGRLLENKMPTGVAVVPSMVHGGPFPATSHPGFSAVGMPGAVQRFAALRCYDGVDETRLPAILV